MAQSLLVVLGYFCCAVICQGTWADEEGDSLHSVGVRSPALREKLIQDFVKRGHDDEDRAPVRRKMAEPNDDPVKVQQRRRKLALESKGFGKELQSRVLYVRPVDRPSMFSLSGNRGMRGGLDWRKEHMVLAPAANKRPSVATDYGIPGHFVKEKRINPSNSRLKQKRTMTTQKPVKKGAAKRPLVVTDYGIPSQLFPNPSNSRPKQRPPTVMMTTKKPVNRGAAEVSSMTGYGISDHFVKEKRAKPCVRPIKKIKGDHVVPPAAERTSLTGYLFDPCSRPQIPPPPKELVNKGAAKSLSVTAYGIPGHFIKEKGINPENSRPNNSGKKG